MSGLQHLGMGTSLPRKGFRILLGAQHFHLHKANPTVRVQSLHPPGDGCAALAASTQRFIKGGLVAFALETLLEQ